MEEQMLIDEFKKRFPLLNAKTIQLSTPICFGDQMIAGEFMLKIKENIMETCVDLEFLHETLNSMFNAVVHGDAKSDLDPQELQLFIDAFYKQIEERKVSPLQTPSKERRLGKLLVEESYSVDDVVKLLKGTLISNTGSVTLPPSNILEIESEFFEHVSVGAKTPSYIVVVNSHKIKGHENPFVDRIERVADHK
jgi:hypothetical protein